MSRLQHFLLIAALCTTTATQAQWGVHAGFHWEQYTKHLDGHWGVGADRDLSGRTSVRLSVVGTLPMMQERSGSFTKDGQLVSYLYERKALGVQYRSIYFLRDDVSGAYIGTTVGFRSLQRTVRPEWVFVPSTATNMVFPVGLCLGVRGELDGFYQDFFIGLGMQLGHGSDGLPPEMADSEHALRGLTLQIGYSFGVGW